MKRLLMILSLLVLLSGCDLDTYVPGNTPTPPATMTPKAITATPSAQPSIILAVCTAVDGGRLNVRACPGVQCAVKAVLEEATQVAAGQEAAAPDGSLWIEITSPVQGWAAKNYLCARKP